MHELITYMARNLVEDAAAVSVRRTGTDDAPAYELRVAPADKGKVIGRQGRTIRALRALVGAASLRSGTHATVEVVD